MFLIYLSIALVYCQLQLNPINGQNFFYRINDVVNTSGYTLQLLQPNLGFQLQGGFTSGGMNSTIQIQNVISTSQYQKMNLIGLLEYNTQYSVYTLTYNLTGNLNSQTLLFNVPSTNQTCQNFEIIGYVYVILHCINTLNNQIVFYFYNNTQLISVNTGYTLNNISQLQSTNIQYYYEDGTYDLYFIYISQFQSYVLNTQLYNNTFTTLEQIWSQPAQYIQIFVSFEQEVFALQFNYLLYQFENYKEKFSFQNGSNWISMDILYDEFDEFLILLVNNYTIYEIYFDYTFKVFSQQQLPVAISNAQIFSDIDYIFILTPQQTLVYQYEGDTFQFYQYSQYSIYNQLNLYSSLSNMIISTNTTGIQLFQLLDYYLYNNQPNQSGFITIGMFNLNNQMTQSESIYINVLPSYQSQICPQFVNFSGVSQQSSDIYYQTVDISEFYIGSNLTYSINQTTLNGVSIINQKNNQVLSSTIDEIGVYSISYLNALLNVQITNDILFQIVQYSLIDQDYQEIIQQKIKLKLTLQDIYFMEYDNGTIMTLIASYNYIYAFEVNPTVGVIQYYTINLTDTLNNTNLYINSAVVIDNLLIILDSDYQITQVQIFTSYYEILSMVPSNYSFMAGYQYEQFYVFAVKFINDKYYVDVYTWVQGQFQLFQTLLLSFISNNVYGVHITPVQNGIFVTYEKTQLRFYDKSTFIENNIGKQQFYFQVDTTNITISQQLQSDQYQYYFLKYNDEYYVNIYQGTQIINSLYQSIKLNVTSLDSVSLSATSDYLNECDYLAISSNNYQNIYQIPHKITYQQMPNTQNTIQYGINNTFNVSNLNNSQLFYVNFTILQENLQISQVQGLPQISNNLTNWTLYVNPYDYFTGAIQTYNVSCSQCQNVSLSNIITNNYIYYYDQALFSASYIQNNVQYLYNLNIYNLFLLTYNLSNQSQSQTNMTQNITNLATFPLLSEPILLFLEVQTNSITWLVNVKSALYIYTIINGTQNTINMTVPGFNSTNTAEYAVYNDGILQILTFFSYNCYYYYISNQTMKLVSIIENVFAAPQLVLEAVGFLDVYDYQDNYIFGIYYQNIYNNLVFTLLDVTVQNQTLKLNDYQTFPLEEMVSFQKDFPFQYVQQYGQPYLVNYTTFVHLAYTTALSSGILELQFDGINLVSFQQVCNIFIINSTFSNNYLNLLSLYGNQLAIMNLPQDDQYSNLTLSIYLIDLEQCQNFQPYSFQILGTFNNSVGQYAYSLIYLNSNQLLLSLGSYTYVIEVNQFLEISYSTTVNSTIILTAQNPYYSLNESISITFTPNVVPNVIPNNSNNTNNNTTSHHLQWYWILLITIVSLLVIGAICLLLYFKLKSGDESNYQQFQDKNEIEIKNQKGF